MRVFKFLICTTVSILMPLMSKAESSIEKPKIHMINMGGNDCPPCVSWRQFELPKLEKMLAFKSIEFTHVTKVIRSPVPPAFWLPENVKPLKKKLDIASNGLSGSPHMAVIVNGEIYDYYTGTRSAENIEKMILAIQNKTKYPFIPCAKLLSWGSKCAQTSLQPDDS